MSYSNNNKNNKNISATKKAEMFMFLRKYKLHECHIQESSRDDAEYQVVLPKLKPDYDRGGDDLWEPEGRRDEIHFSEAVYDEHSDDRRRQHVAEILYEFRRFPL